MDRFQLSYIDTESLLILREDVRAELARRRQTFATDARRKFIKSLRELAPESNADIEAHNASMCLAPPSFTGDRKNVLSSLSRYLPALVLQDWSAAYPLDDGEAKFYVYAHIDPRGHCFVTTDAAGGNWGGEPFYIGKGTGDRAFDLKRNQAHGKRIKAIIDDGFSPADIVKVVFGNLKESEALCLEAKLIFFFGTEYSRKSGVLVNLDTPKTPEVVGSMTRYKTKKFFREGGAV